MAAEEMPGPTAVNYDGLHFERQPEDGSVIVNNDDQLVIQIPARDWAAIVADVSWAGRTPDRHERALRFHGDEMGDADG